MEPRNDGFSAAVSERALISVESFEEFTVDIREPIEGGVELARQDERQTLHLLQVKVLIHADGGTRLEAWFVPESAGLLSTASTYHGQQRYAFSLPVSSR